LPQRVQIQALLKILALSGEPRPEDCKKLIGMDNKYRLRVGEYRVIYKIDDNAQTVKINKIAHRQDAYKK
jgi:mRNA interferase RelE/StbE